MNYTARSKERRSKLLLMKLLNTFQFQGVYLPISSKITLVGNCIVIFSLFQSWIIDNVQDVSWSSFSSISWNIGYILLLTCLTIFFVILSTNKKQKLKHYTSISFRNHTIIGSIGIFTILTVIMSISFIHGFSNIYQNLMYWNWGIIALTWGFVMTFWAYLIRKENKKMNIDTFISHHWELKEKVDNKNNMTLPF